MGPLKQKRRKRHTFSCPPGYRNLDDYSPISTVCLESSMPTVSETDPEESLSPNQINLQLNSMPSTDVQNSFSNPSVAAVPREWVLPSQVSYPSIGTIHGTVKPGVVIPKNRPGYSVLANLCTGSNQPAVCVGSNGRYYQQIARSSSSQKDNNPNVQSSTGQQPVALEIRPQPMPIMSTIQENNRTTHFMVPPASQYGQSSPRTMSTSQVHQPLINNYPALNPIYTMLANSNDETSLTSTNATVSYVQDYTVPTSLPVSQKITAVSPRVVDSDGENSQNNSLGLRQHGGASVVSESQNPPDIISVLTNPKAAQTPIATVCGAVGKPTQPAVHLTPLGLQVPNQQFKPSANGAFKPPPPKLNTKLKSGPSYSQNGRPSTPNTMSCTASPVSFVRSSASDDTKKCSSVDEQNDKKTFSGSNRELENTDNSSLEDFANELGNISPNSVNELNPTDEFLIKHTPPISARNRNLAAKHASVVDRPIRDASKQV